MEVVSVSRRLLPESSSLSTITRGRIFTAQQLDRELSEMYQLTLVARDISDAPLSTSVSISITVLDVNDNVPAFAQAMWNFSIEENINNALIMEFNVRK